MSTQRPIANRRIANRRTDQAEALWLRRDDRMSVSAEQLRRAHRTTEGFLVLDAFAARPGVYEYSEGGRVVRELIDGEILHRAEDLGTLGRKPVTLLHPTGPVTPQTVRAHMVGAVGEHITITADGFVQVTLAVHRDDAIAAIEGGVREISCGYYPVIDRKPGVWTAPDGTSHAYDQRQIARSYEHLALVPAGRHGPEVRARLDGSSDQGPSGDAMKIKRKIRLDAKSTTDIEAEQDIIDAVIALEAHRDAETARADAAAAELATVSGKLAATEAELAKAKTDAAEAAKANAPEELQKRADARAELVAVAVKAGVPAEDAKKLDGIDLRKRIVAARYPAMKVDAMEASAIDGAYAVVVAQLDAEPASGLAGMARTVTQPHRDAGPEREQPYWDQLRGIQPAKPA